MCLGIPGQIIKITNAEKQMALVDVSGVQREISLECVVDEYHPLERCGSDVEGPARAWRSASGAPGNEGIGVEPAG